MSDGVHRLPVRVYYEDTDAAGIVYHTAYLRFAERGRTEFLRVCGFDHRSLRAQAGGNFIVRNMEIDFASAAHLDDELVVETRIVSVAGASARMEQVVKRDDERIAGLDVRLAFLTPLGRPARLPAEVRQAFLEQAFLEQQ